MSKRRLKSLVRWVMNREQFSLFEAWYKYYAKEGAEWFVIKPIGRTWVIKARSQVYSTI